MCRAARASCSFAGIGPSNLASTIKKLGVHRKKCPSEKSKTQYFTTSDTWPSCGPADISISLDFFLFCINFQKTRFFFSAVRPCQLTLALSLAFLAGILRTCTLLRWRWITNNPALYDEIERKGWKCLVLAEAAFPLSDDYVQSSLQSKYVKFLQFLKHPTIGPQFVRYARVLYADHKHKLTPRVLQQLSDAMCGTTGVVMRNTPACKTNVWEKFHASLLQERYAAFASVTKAYIDSQLAAGRDEQTVVCNTGLMLYDVQNPRVHQLVSKVYRAVVHKLGNPECQIVWCLVCQEFSDLVQVLDWSAVGLERAVPSPS